MKNPLSPNDKGQVIIFVTLAFVILGMFIGLAVDGGRAYLMRERLRSIIDAAALAGAKAMAGSFDNIGAAVSAATTAACDSAKVNGLESTICNTGNLRVDVDPSTFVVSVTGNLESRTFFMALGALFGCESCKSIQVAHMGQAVPDTLIDLVLVLDDTGTMSQGCDSAQTSDTCPINSARQGANALVQAILVDTPNSTARIALVPFRGCYADTRNLPLDPVGNEGGKPNAGCITFGETIGLTDRFSVTTLTTAINARRAEGGYPGTNICVAIHEGRKKLFGTGSRPIARKIMVLLTDGDETYSDHAWGKLGFPQTPWPYPTSPYSGGAQSGKDAGQEPRDAEFAVPGSCMSPTPPGNSADTFQSSLYDSAINSLDVLTKTKASLLKTPKTSGNANADNIEIYVLRFASPADPSGLDPTLECDPSKIDGKIFSSRDNSNEAGDRNLAHCIASNRVMGDPFADPKVANDHYFYARTADDIKTKFKAIADNILRKRRLIA